MSHNEKETTESLQRRFLEDDDLDAFIYHNIHIFDEENFHSYLLSAKRRSPYTIKDIIEGTYIDASYCYQIFRGIRLPSRNKILQIALFLAFDLPDINRLLKLADKSPLYVRNLRDAIIIHGVHHRLSLDEIELMLLEKGCNGLTE